MCCACVLQDSNDFTPEFSANTYAAQALLETAAVGAPVTQVSAQDGDAQGVNQQVRYRIVRVEPQQGTELFYMAAEEGQVSVSRPLTEHDADRYVASEMLTALQYTMLYM